MRALTRRSSNAIFGAHEFWAECRPMTYTRKAPTAKRQDKSTLWRGVAAPFVLAIVLAACSPRVDTRGNAIHLEDVATIEVGVHTKDHVYNKLGSPSNQSTFGQDTWYYMSERTETTAFFAPELKERQIIIVKFNEHGVVEDLDILGKDIAENVVPADRTTPTAGNTLNIFEQMMSNLGRFNKK